MREPGWSRSSQSRRGAAAWVCTFVLRTNHNRAGSLNVPSNFPINLRPDTGFSDSSPQQPLRGRRDQEEGLFSAAGGPGGAQSAAAGGRRAPSCLPAGGVWE